MGKKSQLGANLDYWTRQVGRLSKLIVYVMFFLGLLSLLILFVKYIIGVIF